MPWTRVSAAGSAGISPIYTRPAEWQGRRVPDVLLSGHHGAVASWRLAESETKSRENGRPDLLGHGRDPIGKQEDLNR